MTPLLKLNLELLFIIYLICPLKENNLLMISLNSSNIHGCSNVMILLEMDLLMMLNSGKELKTISLLFL